MRIPSFAGGWLFSIFLALFGSLCLRDEFYSLAFVCHMQGLRSLGNMAFIVAFAGSVYFSLRYSSPMQERGTWRTQGVVIFLACLSIVRMALPDNSYDTLAYHLYLQQNTFKNNLLGNFFPCDFRTFSFPLGDEALGLSRGLLGYRLGTVLNAMVIILLYFQIRQMLVACARKCAFPVSMAMAETLTFLVISTEQILIYMGTYMVDLFPIPFLLEILNILLLEDGDAYAIYWAAFLSSLCIALKLTSVPFVAVLLLFFTFMHRQRLKAGMVVVASVLLMLPVAPYLLYNYASVGNPVFPYYNTIFKSPFWKIEKFRDMRWCPHGIFEFLIWPFLVTISPSRLGELNVYSGRIAVGTLASMFVCGSYATASVKRIRGANDSSGSSLGNHGQALAIMAVLCLVSLFLWVGTTAYCRYAIWVELLGGMVAAIVIVKYVATQQTGTKFFAGVAALLLGVQVGACYYLVILKNTDWSWHPGILHNFDLYWSNMKLFGRDRSMSRDDQRLLADVDLWLDPTFSGIASILNGKAIICDSAFVGRGDSRVILPLYDEFQAKVRGKRTFMAVAPSDAHKTMEDIAQEGFIVGDAYAVHPYFMAKGETLAILEVIKRRKGRNPSQTPMKGQTNEITSIDMAFIPKPEILP